MARPIKQGLEYFPHDIDASADEKIESLCALYANDGYAFYFRMCERIYRTETGELDISDAETRQILARKCHLSVARFDRILNSCLQLQLFSRQLFQQGKLSSPGIKRRMDAVSEKRRHERTRYEQEKASKGVSDAETPQGKPRGNHAEMQQGKSGVSKESKVSNTPLPPSTENHNSFWDRITPEKRATFSRLFPGINIEVECVGYEAWCQRSDRAPTEDGLVNRLKTARPTEPKPDPRPPYETWGPAEEAKFQAQQRDLAERIDAAKKQEVSR